jgi:hypothetical protein
MSKRSAGPSTISAVLVFTTAGCSPVGRSAGVLEAVKGFRRLKGRKEMPNLVAALRARDQQLGLSTRETAERVA